MQSADTVFINGKIYTMDGDLPRAEAIAVNNGRISAVGTTIEIADRIATDTHCVDLGGRMVMPGLIDAHCHPVKGAIANLFTAKIAFSDTIDTVAAIVDDAAKNTPPGKWIIGGRWGSGLFDGASLSSPREWLDRITTAHPVYLRDDSGHNGCANSAALAALGIGKTSEDPPGGKIVREADELTPNGLLLEQADVDARAQIPDWT